MPIVFLLHRMGLEFAFGASKLSPWVRVIQDEELLVDRARSMFATRWFGADLPLAGASLRIAICNITALRQRYAAVQPPAPGRLDIGTPLAALIGTAVGSLLNPMTIIPFAVFAAVGGLWTVLAVALVALLGPATGLLVGTLGIAAAPSLLIDDWLGASGPVGLLAVSGDFVAVLVTFLDALTNQWDAILGSVVKLAGPILGYLNDAPPQPIDPTHDLNWWKAVLDVFVPVVRQVALLLPLLTDAFVLIMFTGGSVMKKIAEILPKFLAFSGAAFDLLQELFSNFIDALKKGIQSPGEILTEALRQAVALLTPTLDLLTQLLDKYTQFLKSRIPKLKSAFSTWLDNVIDDLSKVFWKHPLVRLMDNLITSLDNAINLMKDAFWAGFKAKAVDIAGPLGAIAVDKLRAKAEEPGEPFFPAFKLPDTAAIFAGLKDPKTFDALAYSPAIGDLPTIPAHLIKPISVFGGIRQELKVELKQDPSAALASAHAEEKRLRGFIFDVVARQLPADLQPKLGKLRGVFQMLDRALSPLEPESTRRELPVRSLPEDPRVLPVVGRLTLRARGIPESELRQWLPALREALGQQSYLKVA